MISDDSMEALSAGIIVQAIHDWKKLCMMERKNILAYGQYAADEREPNFDGENFISIMHFLRSEYGQLLCEICCIANQRVVEFLEDYWVKNRNNAIEERRRRNEKRRY